MTEPILVPVRLNSMRAICMRRTRISPAAVAISAIPLTHEPMHLKTCWGDGLSQCTVWHKCCTLIMKRITLSVPFTYWPWPSLSGLLGAVRPRFCLKGLMAVDSKLLQIYSKQGIAPYQKSIILWFMSWAGRTYAPNWSGSLEDIYCD